MYMYAMCGDYLYNPRNTLLLAQSGLMDLGRGVREEDWEGEGSEEADCVQGGMFSLCVLILTIKFL